MKSRSLLSQGIMLALSIGSRASFAVEPASSTPATISFPGPAAAAPALPLDGFSGIGSMFVRNNRLDQLGWSDQQIAAFVEGVRAALAGKAYPMTESTRQVGADMMRRVQQVEKTQARRVPGGFDQPGKLEAYLRDAKKRLRMQEAESGLLYLIRVAGRGTRPTPTDTVVITLTGTDANGQAPLPEISAENLRIKLSALLPGLREGLQMMTVGSEATFVLPPSLAFAATDWPTGVGPGVPLTFTVTLHEVISTP